jgi:hypothetical protein
MAFGFCGILVLGLSLIVDELVLDMGGVWFVVYFPSKAEWVLC